MSAIPLQGDPSNPAGAVPATEPVTRRRRAWARIAGNRLTAWSALVLTAYLAVAVVAFAGALDRRAAATVGPSYAPPRLISPDTGAPAPSLRLGTGLLGRSVLWRLLYGARVALTVALLASAVSIAVGTTLGLFAGYFGGRVDDLITGLIATISSVPRILLLLSLAFVLTGYELPFVSGPGGDPVVLTGIPTIVIALGLTNWVGLVPPDAGGGH